MEHQPERRVDKVSKSIKASPNEVYEAILTPDALVTWLPPTGMTGHVDLYEPWEGGSFQITLTYTDAEFAQAGKTTDNQDVTKGIFQKLVPNQQIIWGGHFESEDAALQQPMQLTWLLEKESAEMTKVTIRVENVPEAINKQVHLDGLNSTLANLDVYLRNAKD